MGGKAGSNRRSKKNNNESTTEQPEQEEYKVEKIVGDRKIKGRTQYKVHWEGYTTDDETWENESQVHCDELIEDYWGDKEADEGGSSKANKSRADDVGNAGKDTTYTKSSSSKTKDKSSEEEDISETENDKPVVEKKSTKKLSSKANKSSADDDDDNGGADDGDNSEKDENKPVIDKKSSKKRKKSHKKKEDSPPKKGKSDTLKHKKTENGQNEFEVEKIVEMHTLRNGDREFLVHWVGYTKEDDTWEPERNLKGTDLLNKFLEKVQKAKEVPAKELRMHRKPTDRFTAISQGDKRRQSKRFNNRQRVKYYDAE